jgi:hypothetical protein
VTWFFARAFLPHAGPAGARFASPPRRVTDNKSPRGAVTCSLVFLGLLNSQQIIYLPPVRLWHTQQPAMGNTSTKEARPPYAHTPRHGRGSGQGDGFHHQQSSPYGHPSGSSRHNNRGSRPDLSFLGINTNERDPANAEPRRETKQEREARKRDQERAARLKERERSIKEEHVDGGFLVTQGVYVGTEDFNKAVVRQLIVRLPLRCCSSFPQIFS